MKPQRESILVVDDDSEVLTALEAELSDFFDVTPLLSAEQALATLQGRAFSAIISDVRMPGVDGLSLIKQCAVRYPDMVRVILTAFDDEDVQETAMGPHGAYKLIKPWGDDLIVTLQNALKQRQSKIELQRSHDLENAATELDLRLHLKLKRDEVLPAVASEILRVPEVLCAALYRLESDGTPHEPLMFGVQSDMEVPSLTKQKRVSSPVPINNVFRYSVPIGLWPNPLAVVVVDLMQVNDNSIRYLDYVGRQGYRTLLIVDELSKLRESERISSSGLDYGGINSTEIENKTAKWISSQLLTPSTVVVSAADGIRELIGNAPQNTPVEKEHAHELEEIAIDLDSVYADLNAILDKMKSISETGSL